MKISEIRRTNLGLLEEKYTTLAKVGKLTDTPASYLSNVKTGVRNMGHAVARRIEDRLGLGDGWMDVLQVVVPDTDPMLSQLIFFYQNINADRRDALLGRANALYNEEHPGKSKADPFGDGGTPQPPKRPSPSGAPARQLSGLHGATQQTKVVKFKPQAKKPE